MSLISDLKNIMFSEGPAGTVGHAGAGIIGSYVEANVAPTMGGPWAAAAVNALTKLAAYHFGVKYVPGVDKTEVRTGIAINLFEDVVYRLLNGGSPPPSPTIFGYNVLNKLGMVSLTNRPDRAGDFRYADGMGDYSPAVQGIHTKYGQMPQPGYVSDRQKYYGSMRGQGMGQDLVRIPYGAMPYEQDSPKTARQRGFGFSSGAGGSTSTQSDSYVNTMFGMQ